MAQSGYDKGDRAINYQEVENTVTLISFPSAFTYTLNKRGNKTGLCDSDTILIRFLPLCQVSQTHQLHLMFDIIKTAESSSWISASDLCTLKL